MATKIDTYQCPACTGPLHFGAASGKLECEYCGSSYDVAEVEAFYGRKKPAEEPKIPCPACGAKLADGDTLAKNTDGDMVGCNRCIRYYEIWEILTDEIQ